MTSKAMEEDGTFEKLSKKEVIKLRLEHDKARKVPGRNQRHEGNAWRYLRCRP